MSKCTLDLKKSTKKFLLLSSLGGVLTIGGCGFVGSCGTVERDSLRFEDKDEIMKAIESTPFEKARVIQVVRGIAERQVKAISGNDDMSNSDTENIKMSMMDKHFHCVNESAVTITCVYTYAVIDFGGMYGCVAHIKPIIVKIEKRESQIFVSAYLADGPPRGMR
ncbi:MAG: hypothetical protein JNK11_03890 [Alphaproteobacteria bacterium]|nr:hypothetical protein [Alphaproteobacteria bacterium]